jgi:hypothetical protein
MLCQQFASHPLLREPFPVEEHRSRGGAHLVVQPGRQLAHPVARRRILDRLRPAVIEQQAIERCSRLDRGQARGGGDGARVHRDVEVVDVEITEVENSSRPDGKIGEVGNRALEVRAGAVSKAS